MRWSSLACGALAVPSDDAWIGADVPADCHRVAPASRVSPIDKLSLPLTIVLAVVFLGESVSWRLGLGVALMMA